MESYRPPSPDNPAFSPYALRVVAETVLDWRAFARYLRVDLARSPFTVEYRLRGSRHMARHGFSWPTFSRDPMAAREEARRWIDWKKQTSGRDSSSNYELVINDVARFLSSTRNQPLYELAKVPYTDAEYGHPDPYTAEEIQALQSYESLQNPFTGQRRRAMSLLSSFWGGRRIEHSRLLVSDVDLDELVLDMRLPGKGGKKRKVPLPSLLASPKRALVPYLEERARRFPGAKALWLTNDGLPMHHNTLSRETFHMSQELGFPVSFNRWRRSWQTTVRRCGVPKEIGKYLLGHQWGTDATDHYWQPDVEDVRRILHEHKVPGFIRSRGDQAGPVHLPVPFARSRGLDGERILHGNVVASGSLASRGVIDHEGVLPGRGKIAV